MGKNSTHHSRLPSTTLTTRPSLLTYPASKHLKQSHETSDHPLLSPHLQPVLFSGGGTGVGGAGGLWRGTTSTCLAGCWCSHRPLASCHLWDHRGAAGTPRGSCSPAHSATVSLAHREGRREEEEGGGDNISITLAKRLRLVPTQTTISTPGGGWPKGGSLTSEGMGMWFCSPLDSVLHHSKPHYLAETLCDSGPVHEVKSIQGPSQSTKAVQISKLCPNNSTLPHVS